MSRDFVAYTSLFAVIVPVVVVLLFQVVRSSLLHVTLMALTKLVQPAPTIVPVIIIAQVAHHASPVITNVLGLVVVNQVG